MALNLEACLGHGRGRSCRGMRARRAGAIVNVASCHSFRVIPHTFPYPVAKHGLLGLTRALGVEYAAEGIRCERHRARLRGNADCTRLLDDASRTPRPNGGRAYNLHPPGRIGRPEEVAMTAVFLASDEAPFINAACIVIDGGRSALYHD